MNAAPATLQESVPWPERIRQELLPFPGRLAGSLRTTLAVCITVTAVMVFRTPAVAPGVFLVFLVSYETPYVTLTSGLHSLLFQSLGIGSTLLMVMVTDNSPMARVLGTALFSFIAAFLLRTMRRRGAIDFGVLSLMTLSLWDMKLPANELVKLSLWPLGNGAMAVIVAVAVEYAFTRRDPFYAVHREFEVRMQAIESLLREYARPSDSIRVKAVAKEVVRLAFAGQGKMRSLLEEIGNRSEGAEAYVDLYPIMLPNLFHLLNLAANFSLQRPEMLTAAEQARALRLAEHCAAIRQAPLHVRKLAPAIDDPTNDLLGHMGSTLAAMGDLEVDEAISWTEETRGHKQAPPPWFAADAWTNPDYLDFSFRISLCATLCYIIYCALDWPGINTAVITALIVGLNTTGAMSQKLILRIIGSLLGGVVFGIGAVIFLFPHMDTITSFILLVGAVTFVATWFARAPHISYIGLQIAFSFFLIAFEGYSAPVSMVPGRDRIVGISLALLVIWVVFLEVKPVRTVEEMRRSLARALGALADYIRLASADLPPTDPKGVQLRQVITRELVGMNTMAEMVPYEIGRRRQRDRRISDSLMQASLAAGNYFVAFLNYLHDQRAANCPDGLQVPQALADGPTRWAECLRDPKASPQAIESTARELPQHDISAEAPVRLNESYVVLKQDILDALLTLQAEGKEPQEQPAASAWVGNQ